MFDEDKEDGDDDVGLREYCEQTTLHGWLYLATTSQRRFWRVVWTIIVFGSVGVALAFVYKAAEEFTKATVVTTIHSTTEPLSEVYFPAVTVCNINQVNNKQNRFSPLSRNFPREESR